MRTDADILEKLEELTDSDTDYFGFERQDLLRGLSYEAAKDDYAVDGCTKEKWEDSAWLNPADPEKIKEEILNYMPFAWEKANDCRGISASRSVSHIKAWLWLLEDDLYEKMDTLYEYYGKPCLRAVCEKYDWDWTQWDNKMWRNNEGGSFIPPPL